MDGYSLIISEIQKPQPSSIDSHRQAERRIIKLFLQPCCFNANVRDMKSEPQNKSFSRQLIKKTKYMEPELTSAEVPNLFFPGDTNPREDKMGCRIQKPKETNAKRKR